MLFNPACNAASVGSSLRPLRTNSGVSNFRWSCLMPWLIAGCDTPPASAAAAKLPCSITSLRYCR